MKYFFLLLIPFFMACEDAIQLDANKVSSIHYSFRDSSVPPRYHRSYDITITPTEAHVTVNSYGDLLADETYPITIEQFSDLIQTINNANLVSGIVKPKQGCTGGTAESLVIKEENVQCYKASIDNCGGTAIPASFGDYGTAVDAIKGLVPDLKELRK